MVKAAITLPNGTTIEVEGSSKEVSEIIKLSGGLSAPLEHQSKGYAQPPAGNGNPNPPNPSIEVSDKIDVSRIVKAIRDHDQIETIEQHILDARSQVNRTLLPLYIVHEELNSNVALTSGDISDITRELRCHVTTANVSHTLAGSASKYVSADKLRAVGHKPRYTINRRGIAFIKSILSTAKPS